MFNIVYDYFLFHNVEKHNTVYRPNAFKLGLEILCWELIMHILESVWKISICSNKYWEQLLMHAVSRKCTVIDSFLFFPFSYCCCEKTVQHTISLALHFNPYLVDSIIKMKCTHSWGWNLKYPSTRYFKLTGMHKHSKSYWSSDKHNR